MAAHNYDSDINRQVGANAQIPRFRNIDVAPDGSHIKEFEASHGTVTDMNERLRTKSEPNPLGVVEVSRVP